MFFIFMKNNPKLNPATVPKKKHNIIIYGCVSIDV